MLDLNLFLRTGGVGSMSSTETSSAKTIKETPVKGLSAIVVVPQRDVGDTMQVTIQESTNNSTWDDAFKFTTIASVTETTTTPIVQRGRFHSRGKYFRSVTTVAGTTPDFGAVQIAIGAHDAPNNYKLGAGVATSLDQN